MGRTRRTTASRASALADSRRGARTTSAGTIRRITEILHDAHRSPDHGNKSDPLDELVYIVLSQMTTAKSFGRVFDRLKAALPDWGRILRMPTHKLKAAIKDAGLSNQKAPRIRAIVRQVVHDFGVPDLSPLRAMNDRDAQAYLTSLPGVGIKTAKCVLMYSLGRQVLPVDTHVARLATRLGLVPSGLTTARLHERLEALVRPPLRYSFHVNAVAHGQKVCLAGTPRCKACPVARLCPSRRA